MYTHSPSARMQVVELGNLQQPAACSVCGNGTCLEGYLDTDVWIEYYGQVYLCMNCAKQLVEAIGGLIPEEAQGLKDLSDKIAKDYAELKETHESAITRLDMYDTLVLSAANGMLPSIAAKEQPESADRLNDASADGADVGESESEEPVKSGTGPDDAPLFKLGDEGQLLI